MFIHYMYVDITMFERVTTHYQNLRTWIGHSATRCHNFNVLPYALAFIFSQINIDMCYYFFSLSLACFGGYLQRFAMRYRKIY